LVESLFDNIVHNERVLEDLRSELRKLEYPSSRSLLRDSKPVSPRISPGPRKRELSGVAVGTGADSTQRKPFRPIMDAIKYHT